MAHREKRRPPKTMAVDERAALAELKRRVGALPDDLVVAGDVDAAFRRFLVARKWDVDKAEAQLRATLTWRKEQFRVQSFLATPPRARLALVRSLLPGNPHLGFSKEGWPVTLINIGASDPARAAQELTGEDLVADLVMRAEFYRAVVFPEATKLAGRLVDKEVVLLDFGGMSLSLLKLKSAFSTMNSVGSSYFPERTVLFFVLNAPGLFSMLWNLLKGLVDPRTQKKIHILSGGSRQLEVLREHLHDAVIPKAYGGARPDPSCSGRSLEETSQIYARLDSWLASHAVLKSATAPASPAQPPAPSAAQVVAAPTTKLDAPVLSNGPAPPDLASTLSVPGGASHSAAASTPLRTTDVVVLYLLWLLSSVIFAALAWAQIHRYL